MRNAALLTLLSLLSITAPACALGFIIRGNEPLKSDHGMGKEFLATVNSMDRVYMVVYDFRNTTYFKSVRPAGINEGMRRFAAIPVRNREIILLTGPPKPFNEGMKQQVEYNWSLYMSVESGAKATLTIYIPEPLPAPPADPKQGPRWIADLDSDDFKIRDRATRELAKFGPSLAPVLREALKGKLSAEKRERLERLLAEMSRDLRLDALEIPEGVPIECLDTQLASARKGLANADVAIRSKAVWQLINVGAPAEDVLPDFEKLLKTEKDASVLAAVARVTGYLGAGAKPLLPLLRETAKTTDKNLASICQESIARIEKATAQTVSEAEAKRRATIRKDIHKFVSGLKDNSSR